MTRKNLANYLINNPRKVLIRATNEHGVEYGAAYTIKDFHEYEGNYYYTTTSPGLENDVKLYKVTKEECFSKSEYWIVYTKLEEFGELK